MLMAVSGVDKSVADEVRAMSAIVHKDLNDVRKDLGELALRQQSSVYLFFIALFITILGFGGALYWSNGRYNEVALELKSEMGKIAASVSALQETNTHNQNVHQIFQDQAAVFSDYIMQQGKYDALYEKNLNERLKKIEEAAMFGRVRSPQ